MTTLERKLLLTMARLLVRLLVHGQFDILGRDQGKEGLRLQKVITAVEKEDKV